MACFSIFASGPHLDANVTSENIFRSSSIDAIIFNCGPLVMDASLVLEDFFDRFRGIERYANKPIFISSYMESFVYVTLQPITYMKNVSGLRAICYLDEGIARNLLCLSVPSDTYCKLLVHLLIEKLPHGLFLVISHEFDEKVWDLENMLKYFKKELFAKECCALLVNEKPYNPNKRNENTMSAFLSGQQKLCCVYCQGEHFSTKSDKVINVNARKEISKNSSRCYLCFKT